eukprot:jgi/Tetstr1/444419/TSEL_032307.t1
MMPFAGFDGGLPLPLMEEIRQHQAELRAHNRAALRGDGMTFVDDGSAESRGDVADWMAGESKSKWEQGALRCEQLLVEGVQASSTDDESQSIGNTLDYRNLPDWAETFWSSSGSSTPNEKEHLTYRLRYPLSVVHSVRIQVYRAHYQRGDPIYPARRVMFELGPTPGSMQPATGWMRMRASSQPQTFHLPVSASAAHYLRVVFWGKPQPQKEDMRYYLAMARVQAFGWRIDPQHVAGFRRTAHDRPNMMPMCNGAYLPTHMFGATRVIRCVRSAPADDSREPQWALSETPPVTSPTREPTPEFNRRRPDVKVWYVPPLEATVEAADGGTS